MRPEGCQETGRPARRQVPATHRFQTSFQPSVCLTLLENRDLYSSHDESTHVCAALARSPRARSSWPAALVAQALQRSHVRQRRRRGGRAGPDLGPVGLRRPRRQRRARGPAGRAGRPSRCRSPSSSTTARPREPFIRDYPRGAAGLRRRADRRPSRRKQRVAIIALAERPTILADYTTDRGALEKGVDRILASVRQRHVPARRHHRNQPGVQEARGAAPGHRRDHHRRARAEQPRIRAGARAAARQSAPRSTSSRSACRRAASATRSAIATWCSTRARGPSGGTQRQLLTSIGACRPS